MSACRGDAANQPGVVFEANVDVVEWLGADLYVYFQVECDAQRLPEELRRSVTANRTSLIARVDPSSRAAENERLAL